LGGFTTGRHVSLVELGVLIGLYDGAEVLLKPFFGSLADRVGAKPVLLGVLVGFACASGAFVVAGEPNLLGVDQIAQGRPSAAFSPAAGAMVAVLGGTKGRGRAFGGYGGAKSLGYLLGPLAGGLLVAAQGYKVLFFVLAVLAVIVAVAVVFGVPATAPTPHPRSDVVGCVLQVTRPEFLQPVIVLAAGSAALSAGVGFLPVMGLQRHLGQVAPVHRCHFWPQRRSSSSPGPVDGWTEEVSGRSREFGL
jgi:DHA1 family tetracycline resistance protein-like MFS transporter